MRILYVTWDGPQTNYLEGLFLPIFKKLSENGLDFHILQFTWGNSSRIEAIRKACVDADIGYQAKIVLRHPLTAGSFLTALNGARLIRKAIRVINIDVVMPRSTLPALATLLALRGSPVSMVFDADGLPLDERVDFSGLSSSSLIYRFLRDIESQAVRRADVVLTRSHKAVDILISRAGAGTSRSKIYVVGNGHDPELFSPGNENLRLEVRTRLNITDTAPLIIYAGSIGPQYCPAEMFSLFSLVHQLRSDTRFLILTGSPESLPPILSQFPSLSSFVDVMSVPAQDVSKYLASADLGLALRKSSFSMQGVAPIKLGEYLLCGVPVIAAAKIGDTDAITEDVGYLLEDMKEAELQAAANWFVSRVLPDREAFRSRCSKVGEKHFSLESSVRSYMSAFENLTT